MVQINLNNLTKRFDDGEQQVVAVDDVTLEIEDGEFLVLVGPSGCGKTTTLRCLSGLESVSEGEILFDGEDVTSKRASERDVAMVFQNYALYPHMNVRKNMGFGLKLSTELSTSEIKSKVESVADMMGIGDLLDDLPKELSGGQQQRVALGRAIVREPGVFLMDEPLSNLDAKLRTQMRTEIQSLQDELNTTAVYVTHDQTEAMAMGDRIAVMNDGVLQQAGPPEELYRRPVNRFVAGFIGSPSINLYDVRVDGHTLEGPGSFSYELEDVSYVENRDRVTVGIRPEDFKLKSGGENEALVDVVEAMGNENFVYGTIGDEEFVARVDSSIRPESDETVSFSFDEESLYLFDHKSGDSIKTKSDLESFPSQPSVE
ncbi:ABC transporter ATP-binding protein [Haloarcula marina]|uniref:ABC transporter ATP-binding protein n=1 Tax=Haloarcula marina TaxID=2961574 RepID=UPI0020B6A401|nr:ABC transporter ATP-binding protein [Halomicroarcula marina]